jgi:PPOX class probable F420-dependent enzyme
MREITAAERREFLLGRASTASLATVRADGGPRVAPIWFDLDSETLLFTTGAGTVKGRNMAQDPRVSLCIDGDDPSFHFVPIGGTAVLASGDPDHL